MSHDELENILKCFFSKIKLLYICLDDIQIHLYILMYFDMLP